MAFDALSLFTPRRKSGVTAEHSVRKPGRGGSWDEKLHERAPGFRNFIGNVPVVCWVFLAVMAAGSVVYYSKEMNFWRVRVEANEADIVRLLSKRIADDFEPAVADLLILSNNPELRRYLANSSAAQRAALEQELLRWSERKPDYYAIGYIAESGQEIARADSDRGGPHVVPREELRDLSKRFYLTFTLSLDRQEIFVSPFDLDLLHEKIEQPLHPTVRFCTPVFDPQGRKRGVLVFHYGGRHILNEIDSETGGSIGQLMLLNSDGYWLRSPVPDDEWGFMFKEKAGRTFGNKFPEAWAKISVQESGRFYSSSGFFVFNTLSPFEQASRHVYNKMPAVASHGIMVSDYSWKLVSYVPRSLMREQSGKILMRIGLLNAVGLLILSVVAAGQARSRMNRERAAEAMKRQAALLDLALDAIVVRDLNHSIIYWNAGAQRLYGWAREEAIGRNYMKFLRPVSDPPEAPVIPTVLAKGQWSGEATALHKDGTKIVTLNRIALQRDARGNPAAFLSIATDIRERKKSEVELQAAKEAAESASRAKSEFLAVMSHEIRTPMNGVIGMAGLLLDTPLSPEQREYAETVRHSADALLTIINDILDFSKMEAGKMTIELIPCDLRLAVEDVAELMAGKAREKGLDLILRYSPEAPRRVVADPGRIRQILINLTGNAIKFTTKGHVYLSVVCEERTAEQACLHFSVEDTGIGIPADKLDQIFERFAQADASTTRKFGGTGLGLAISKQLAELMGGAMGVESRAGEGSKFWMTLPLALDQTPAAEVLPSADLSGVRVLGVDDNPTNLFVLREQLTSWGLRNDMSNSAEEALRRLRAARAAGDPYQIAILDQQMPDMDGETLCRTIKSDPDLQDTLTVLLTSLGMRGDATRMKGAGFAAYLTKPARQSQLFDALTMVWSSRSKAGAPELVTRHTLAESRAATAVAKDLPSNVNSGTAATRGRILVVEDNAVNQKVACRLLEKMAFRVDVAANGSEAVEMVNLLPYDVVLMDCQMPLMDGYQATREIRRSEGQGPHRLIIAMTANAMQGDRERCLAAGMDDYLSKPVRAPELAEVLARHLRPSAGSEHRAAPQRTVQ